MDNPHAIQQLALLGLLAAPLVAALFCAMLGQTGVRSLARLFAIMHLGATTLFACTMQPVLSDRGGQGGISFMAKETFTPLAVPGDAADTRDAGVQSHVTTWNLFSVQNVTESLQKPDYPNAIQFFIGIDGLNLWMVWLTSFLTLITIFISEKHITDRLGAFHAWLFVLQSLLIGAFTAFDVVLFYVFFELTLIPVFFLIGQWGVGGGRRDAARKFFLYTLFGSLLTLTGVIGLVVSNPNPVYRTADGTLSTIRQAGVRPGDVADPLRGPITFSIPNLVKNCRTWSDFEERKVQASQVNLARREAALQDAEKRVNLPENKSNRLLRQQADQAREELDKTKAEHLKVLSSKQRVLDYQVLFFFLLMAGFAVKIPIVPFHTWLPSAYGEAPIGITLLLSGVMAKLGTYGVLRLVLPLTPDAAILYGLPVFGTLSAIGIIYAAFCAYAQRDIKMLTAYSSVSHLGLLVLGLFALNKEGLSGATLHMLNHGISTGAMFALLAFLIDRYRTTDSTLFSGLMGKFPAFAAIMMVVALAGVGLPGLNNFVSEMLILSGLVTTNSRIGVGYWLVLAGAAGIFFSAWYTFTMIRRVFFGPEATPAPIEGAAGAGLTASEWVAFGSPAVLCLALGLYPQPILDSVESDVAIVVRSANEARERAGVPQESMKDIPKPKDMLTQEPKMPGPGPVMAVQKGPGGPGGPGGEKKPGGGKKPAGDKANPGGQPKGTAAPTVPPPAKALEVAPMPQPKKN